MEGRVSRDRAVAEHPPNLDSSLARGGFGPRRDTFRAGKEHARACYIRVNGPCRGFDSLSPTRIRYEPGVSMTSLGRGCDVPPVVLRR